MSSAGTARWQSYDVVSEFYLSIGLLFHCPTLVRQRVVAYMKRIFHAFQRRPLGNF